MHNNITFFIPESNFCFRLILIAILFPGQMIESVVRICYNKETMKASHRHPRKNLSQKVSKHSSLSSMSEYHSLSIYFFSTFFFPLKLYLVQMSANRLVVSWKGTTVFVSCFFVLFFSFSYQLKIQVQQPFTSSLSFSLSSFFSSFSSLEKLSSLPSLKKKSIFNPPQS